MFPTTLTEFVNLDELYQLLVRFGFNFLISGIIIKFLYLPKSKNKEYVFNFLLMSVSVFLLIILLSDVKVKVGFALGLFAIFSIIRYRTSQIPIKEMTYMFIFISLAVINAGLSISYGILFVSNLLAILIIYFLERFWIRNIQTSKEIKYEKIELITPDRQEDLLADLKKRTGLNIIRFEIGKIDFLKDTAKVVIYYYENNSKKTIKS